MSQYSLGDSKLRQCISENPAWLAKELNNEEFTTEEVVELHACREQKETVEVWCLLGVLLGMIVLVGIVVWAVKKLT